MLAGYLPDDIVVVDHNRRDAKAGQVVVANLHDWSLEKARTIIRLYEPPYLVAASADPAHRKPVLVDHNQVMIMGVAVALLRVM